MRARLQNKIQHVQILNAVSVGYAQYYSIVIRTITLHTIHVGVLENYAKSNNITKLLTEL